MKGYITLKKLREAELEYVTGGTSIDGCCDDEDNPGPKPKYAKPPHPKPPHPKYAKPPLPKYAKPQGGGYLG